MSPIRKDRGFVLISVVVTITLLAAIAFMLSYQGASESTLASGELERDQLRYIAEAGLAHAEMQLAANTSCGGFTDIAKTEFAGESYSVSFVSTKDSPVTVESTALPDSGTGLTLRSESLRAYEPPTEITLQFTDTIGKDTILDDFYPIRNYGGAGYLKIESESWDQRPVLHMDVSGIPAGATIQSARLELKQNNVNAPGQVFVHRMTREWTEGTKNGGGIADGATWQTHDGTNAWTSPGGEFDSTVYGSGYVTSSVTRPSFDVTALVQDWVSGAVPNYGMILVGDSSVKNAGFASRETNNPADAPKLIVTYACECGSACSGKTEPAGNVLLVVSNNASPTLQDQARQALIESLGFVVTIIDDGATQSDFDNAVAVSDVAYVSEEVASGTLGTKLQGAPIGVVIEEEKIHLEFGLSSGETTFSEDSIDIVDNTHYITSPFGLGQISFVSSLQPVGAPTGALAPGLNVLAQRPSSTTGMLDVIEKGGELYGGGVAAGRRVKLPWGGNEFDINTLTSDGQTIMRRAIEWGAGAGSQLGPIAHWKLDESSGTTAVDSAGGFDGTLTNGPTWATGKVDGALDFDGSDDYIDLSAHAGTFNSMAEGTIAAWINTATSGSGRSIFALADTNDSESYVSFRFDTSNRIKFHVQENNTDLLNVTSTASVPEGEWHHVAVTVGSGGNTLYIDGVAAGVTHSAGNASSNSFFDDVDTTDYAAVAQEKDNSGAERWFGGLIDDVRLYDRALSATEIAAIVAGGGGGPIAHWKLDETNGNVAEDAVGNNDGALNGSPSWGTGEIGGGLSVDYSNGEDYIIVPNSAGLENVQEGDYTLSAWFRPDSTPPGTSGDNDANYGILIKPGWHTGLFLSNQNRFGFWQHLDGDINIESTSGNTFGPGSFYHVAATVDRAGGLQSLYVNGQLEDTSSFTPGAAAREYGTGTWRIGVANPGASSWGWPADGILDDVRIYDRALTAAEITDLAALGGGGGGGGPSSCIFRDEFENQSYGNQDGNAQWAGDWQEVNDGGSPTGGDIRLEGDGNPGESLRIQDDNRPITRAADLSGHTSATLTLEYKRVSLENGEYAAVSVYDGSNWTELAQFGNPPVANDSNFQSYTEDISAYISPNFQIRLATPDGGMGNSDDVKFDNLQIETSGGMSCP